MAKKRVIGKKEADDVSKFKSPNTGEYVMGHQYIAEIIVKRKAEKTKVVLEYKYWNNPDHKFAKEFRSQVTQAAKLIKTYDAKTIIKTLNELFWCFSLRQKKFLELLQKNHIIVERQKTAASEQTIKITNNTSSYKKNNTNKMTTLNKIRNIQNNEK